MYLHFLNPSVTKYTSLGKLITLYKDYIDQYLKSLPR